MKRLGVRTVASSSKLRGERETVGCDFANDDNSTSPGARRFSLSLLLEGDDDENDGDGDGDGDVREVGPTMRRDKGGAPLVREARRRCSARARRPEAKPF